MKKRTAAPRRTTVDDSRDPRAAPTPIARPSAATIPIVDPSHVPHSPSVEARVTVASIVLSPNSAKKKATPTAITTDRVTCAARAPSSSLRLSPRRVQNPKPRKAAPAATVITRIGNAAENAAPIPTERAWATAVATEMPTSTGMIRYRAANASAMSWLLSPNSATKTMPKLIQNASTVGPESARLDDPNFGSLEFEECDLVELAGQSCNADAVKAGYEPRLL